MTTRASPHARAVPSDTMGANDAEVIASARVPTMALEAVPPTAVAIFATNQQPHQGAAVASPLRPNVDASIGGVASPTTEAATETGVRITVPTFHRAAVSSAAASATPPAVQRLEDGLFSPLDDSPQDGELESDPAQLIWPVAAAAVGGAGGTASAEPASSGSETGGGVGGSPSTISTASSSPVALPTAGEEKGLGRQRTLYHIVVTNTRLGFEHTVLRRWSHVVLFDRQWGAVYPHLHARYRLVAPKTSLFTSALKRQTKRQAALTAYFAVLPPIACLRSFLAHFLEVSICVLADAPHHSTEADQSSSRDAEYLARLSSSGLSPVPIEGFTHDDELKQAQLHGHVAEAHTQAQKRLGKAHKKNRQHMLAKLVPKWLTKISRTQQQEAANTMKQTNEATAQNDVPTYALSADTVPPADAAVPEASAASAHHGWSGRLSQIDVQSSMDFSKLKDADMTAKSNESHSKEMDRKTSCLISRTESLLDTTHEPVTRPTTTYGLVGFARTASVFQAPGSTFKQTYARSAPTSHQVSRRGSGIAKRSSISSTASQPALAQSRSAAGSFSTAMIRPELRSFGGVVRHNRTGSIVAANGLIQSRSASASASAAASKANSRRSSFIVQQQQQEYQQQRRNSIKAARSHAGSRSNNASSTEAPPRTSPSASGRRLSLTVNVGSTDDGRLPAKEMDVVPNESTKLDAPSQSEAHAVALQKIVDSPNPDGTAAATDTGAWPQPPRPLANLMRTKADRARW